LSPYYFSPVYRDAERRLAVCGVPLTTGREPESFRDLLLRATSGSPDCIASSPFPEQHRAWTGILEFTIPRWLCIMHRHRSYVVVATWWRASYCCYSQMPTLCNFVNWAWIVIPLYLFVWAWSPG